MFLIRHCFYPLNCIIKWNYYCIELPSSLRRCVTPWTVVGIYANLILNSVMRPKWTKIDGLHVLRCKRSNSGGSANWNEENSYTSPICSVFSNDTQMAEVADEGQFPPDAFSLETRQRGAGEPLHSWLWKNAEQHFWLGWNLFVVMGKHFE